MGVCNSDELPVRVIEPGQTVMVGKFIIGIAVFGDCYTSNFTYIPLIIMYPLRKCVSDSRLAAQGKIVYVLRENFTRIINDKSTIRSYLFNSTNTF